MKIKVGGGGGGFDFGDNYDVGVSLLLSSRIL